MAQNKNKGAKSKKYKYTKADKAESRAGAKSGAKSGTAKKGSRAKGSAQKTSGGAALYIAPICLVLFAIVTAISVIGGEHAGFIGNGYGKLLRGLFGISAFLLPVYAVFFAVFFRRLSESTRLRSKIIQASAVQLLLGLLAHILAGGKHTFSAQEHYIAGMENHGGGLIGSGLGELLWRGLNVIMPILVVGALIILIPLLFDLTPADIFDFVQRRAAIVREARNARRDEDEYDEADDGYDDADAGIVSYGKGVREDTQLPLAMEYGEETPPKRRRVIDVDANPSDALSPEARETDKDEQARRTLPGADRIDVFDENAQSYAPSGDAYEIRESVPEDVPVETPNEPQDAFGDEKTEHVKLSDVFPESEDEALLRALKEKYGDDVDSTSADGDIELEVKRRRVTPIPAENAAVSDSAPEEIVQGDEENAYRLPPVDLLTEDPGKYDPNIAKEIEQNAARLTSALEEFNVRASIQNTMHGPTVTRYELGLDAGVRVRSILSLADDISYSLASPGSIRIEAPIPGKSAVGIEVPNKIRETVYLRTLISAPAFKKDNPLWVALGMDVAGEGVYIDLAKMPHLLIAGTTGSGKSVCINTIIMSLLYRNSPDDMKMILIDPKRVEFRAYEGLPHLLVPVVSDMKKAAGALQWAVSEMERRFGLIEQMGVRDISGYAKAIAASDEPHEVLPRIVIFIDELAELMLVARDAVETSICRIAQKARAAGMHLIIGTQRPSVDVVTGLIKANIPSRIACAVKSQVDSRTMIDKAGAENLMGNGDMLLNPIGIPEPKRVQGAFVSDEEVAAVVSFIKAQDAENTADTEHILAEIEREAARCENPKKGGAASSLSAPGEDGDEDPMLMDALALAVESGKISTSLIQRKLSLGYGRAAKLIDRMQQLGYVGAPIGQKPRDVLITPERFMELKLNSNEE